MSTIRHKKMLYIQDTFNLHFPTFSQLMGANEFTLSIITQVKLVSSLYSGEHQKIFSLFLPHLPNQLLN